MEKQKHAIWGLDTSVQATPLEIGTGNDAKDITALKTEWRSVYPNMKFQLMLNYTAGQQPVDGKWQ